MNEQERMRLLEEIGKRKAEPGIVLEWYQVEMRRRSDVEMDRHEALIRTLQEHQEEFERTLQPAPLDAETLARINAEYHRKQAEIQRQREVQKRQDKLKKERDYEEYQKILANLPPDELKELTAFQARYGRRFPTTPYSLSKAILNFRSFRATEEEHTADKRAYEQYAKRESLWSLEMRDHARMAYIPLRIPYRPMSEMSECSMWTGWDEVDTLLTRNRRKIAEKMEKKI